MADQANIGTKRVREVILKDLNNSSNIIVVPNPSMVRYDPGIELLETMTTDTYGNSQLADIEIDKINAKITATFPKKTINILGMKQWQRPAAQASLVAAYRRNAIKLTANSYEAATSGQEGFGVLADAVSSASYLDETGQSIPLTQDVFATIDSGVDTLSFAVGADRALKFTNDLIGKQVSFDIPYTIATGGTILSEALFNRFSLSLVIIQNDLTIIAEEFSQMVVDPTGEIDYNTLEQELVFRAVYDGSQCTVKQTKYLGRVAACADAVAA